MKMRLKLTLKNIFAGLNRSEKIKLNRTKETIMTRACANRTPDWGQTENDESGKSDKECATMTTTSLMILLLKTIQRFQASGLQLQVIPSLDNMTTEKNKQAMYQDHILLISEQYIRDGAKQSFSVLYDMVLGPMFQAIMKAEGIKDSGEISRQWSEWSNIILPGADVKLKPEQRQADPAHKVRTLPGNNMKNGWRHRSYDDQSKH